MAFINDVKGKISKTSQYTVQKAKDLSETAKLNAAIADMEKQITELYQEIGSKVYRYYHNDPIKKVEDSIQKVSALYQNIESCKKRIEDFSPVKICAKCGTQVNKEMKFCYNCGNEFPMPRPATAETNKPIYCTCGNKISAGSNFCTACGKKLQ